MNIPSFFRKTSQGPTFRFSRRLAALLLGATVLSLLPAAGAATITLFPEGGSQTWPSTDWNVSLPTNPVLVEAATFNGKSWLHIARPSNEYGSRSFVSYTGGSDGVTPGNQLADFNGRIILSGLSGTYPSGVIMRARNKSQSNADAYYVAVIPTSGTANGNPETARLAIYTGLGASLGASTLLVDDPVGFDLDSTSEYRLNFSAVGSTLTASLWSLDAEGDPLAELASVTVQHQGATARTTGYFGLRGGVYSVVNGVYFRDLQVTVIPEPSLGRLSWIGLGLAGFALVRRRMK